MPNITVRLKSTVFTDKRYQFIKVDYKSTALMAIETAIKCGISICVGVVRVTNFRHMRLYMDNSVHANKKQAALAACSHVLKHPVLDADTSN